MILLNPKPRCLKIWEASIKSPETKQAYWYDFEKFRKFVKVENYEHLLQSDEKSTQRLLEDYVISLHGKISPNSFTKTLAPVLLFYALNDVNVNTLKLRKMYPAKVKRSGFNAYTREMIQEMLSHTPSKRTKAIILIFASTGCRVGGLVNLKVGDVEPMPNGCRVVTFYRDEIEEYVGFLTPEASQALEDYLQKRIKESEKITKQSPLIRSSSFLNPRPCTRAMISEAIDSAMKDMEREKDGKGRYLVPTNHGFRKFFNIVMKLRDDVNLSLCEKLLGHSITIPLDNNYLPPNREVLFNEFLKAIPDLTVSNSLRLQEELKQKDIQISTIENQKDRRITQLETKLETVEKLLLSLSKRRFS